MAAVPRSQMSIHAKLPARLPAADGLCCLADEDNIESAIVKIRTVSKIIQTAFSNLYGKRGREPSPSRNFVCYGCNPLKVMFFWH